MNLRSVCRNDLTDEYVTELIDLLSVGFKGPTDFVENWRLRFNCWWFANPNVTDDFPIGWEVRDEKNVLCGFFGNVPVQYQRNSECYLGCGTGPLFVLAEDRSIESSKLFFSFAKQKTADFLISTTPNDNGCKVLKNLRFGQLSESNFVYTYTILPNLYLCSKYLLYSPYFTEGGLFGHFGINFLAKMILGLVLKIVPKNDATKICVGRVNECYMIRNAVDSTEFTLYLNKHETPDIIEISHKSKNTEWMFFSQAVRDFLHRNVNLIFRKSGEYIGYFVTDIRCDKYGRKLLLVREIRMLFSERNLIKYIKNYLISVAKSNSCGLIQIKIICADPVIRDLLKREILISHKYPCNYYLKFGKKLSSGAIDPYAFFRASSLDPDLGLL